MSVYLTPSQADDKTLVLSDIHVGRKGANWKAALKLMRSYRWKQIIVCGDFFDLWYRPTALFALLVSTFFEQVGKKITYVVGNHDNEITDLLFTSAPFWLVTNRHFQVFGQKPFIFVHGHEVDRFNNQISWFGHILTKIQAWIHRIFRVDTHGITSGLIFRVMERKQRKALVEKYRARSRALVFGHTHRPMGELLEEKSTEGRKRTFETFNTGDWVKNNTFLIIDEEGVVTRWKKTDTSKTDVHGIDIYKQQKTYTHAQRKAY